MRDSGDGMTRNFALVSLTLIVVLFINAQTMNAQEKLSNLQFNVNDDKGQSLPCRIHLTDAAGKPQLALGQPFWKDHFVCGGRVALPLPPGRYRYEIERGPEHQRASGNVELQAGRDQTVTVQLSRIADLSKLGWFSGDLHVHRPIQDIELLMQAEDLHVAPVITWWNARNEWSGKEIPKDSLRRFDGNRFYHLMAGEDERGGGALLFFNLNEPLPITKATHEHPSPMKFVEEARQRDKNVWIDIEKPFWWDVPVWLASGQMDSIGIANNHQCRSTMLANEAWGKPRDRNRLPDPLGNGYWTQEIYYHLLNCGLRLPPSAGSASGVLPNPVGYNRVYVHVDGDLTYEKWWSGLKAGQCFVTNGPLLLCKANGQLPGHVFRGDKSLTVKLELTLTSNDRVPRIEVIKDGKVDSAIELDDALSQQRTATVSFRESGWFLVRAIADNKQTYRFASTAPFYVEVGEQKRRVSKQSAQFFLDWVEERIQRVSASLPSLAERQEVLKYHEEAKRFWEDMVKRASME